MKKAVLSMIFFMLTLLCAHFSLTHASLEPQSPKLAEMTPALKESELESELLSNNSEASLEAELEHKHNKPDYELVKVRYTAYYGPRPGQKSYAHGSYKKDVQINGAGKVTAYGTRPRIGIVATDPRVFPRGTKLLMKDPLDGKEKIFIAEDKGGAIKGDRIDIFVGWGTKGFRKTRRIHKTGEIMLVKVIYKPAIMQS